jgi:hypothetical protein
MPERETKERARKAKREGKAPTTQAGAFVKEEIEHVRRGKHGARSPQQAIAIGLSKARRAGVDLPPPERGQASERTRRSASLARKAGQTSSGHRPSARRSRATSGALKHEGHRSASRTALSRQAVSSARRRSPAGRRRAAMKAVRTKGSRGLKRSAQKAARTRQSERRAA